MLSKISYSRRSILFIITIIFTLIHNQYSHATHLTGGEITYSCLGGNEYEINLVVFRDCGTTNSNNTGFDNDGVISIYDMNNNLYDVIEHGVAIEEIIVNEFYFECLQIPDGVCTAKGTYNTVITLPNNDNGYKIVYQRCCRNSQVINLQNPEDMGSSLVAYVPPSSFAECNNSPQFDSNPPLAICLGADLEINQSASDIDGDSLVYSFTAPYHGSSDFSPTETYAPPYAQIPWMSGYSNNYPIDSDPVIEINDSTGIISGSPSQEGYYTIGIKVEEYRNGIYLGEILRDFLFLVTDCPEDENDNCIISGCTDYNAFNFSAEATNDDGSCDYPTDLGTLECGIDSVLYAATTSNYGFENSVYYSFKVDNDSELIINLYGDQSMFQPHILLFDGSQTYMQTFSNTQSYLINEDSINLNTGEYYMVVTQGDPFFYEGTLQDYYNAMETSSQNNGSFTLSLFSYDGICDYTGCTDYNAFNFSTEATNDDGSCEYPSDLGTLECGVNQIISDSTTSNFGFENSVYYSFDLDIDSEMIINPDDFSYYILLFDSSQTYIQSIDIDNYSNDYSINLNAGEYYMTVTHSPVFFYGSTLQDFYNSMETSFKLTGSFTFSLFSYDGICDYPGCIDSTAFNFNTIATIDDGSCDYPTDLGTLECGIDSVFYAATTSNYGFENSVYYSFEVDNDSELIINLDGDESYVPTILLFDSTQTYIQTSDCCYWDSNSLLWININEYSININAGEYYMVVTQDNPYFYEGTLQDYYNEMETNSQNTGSFTLSLLSYDGTCDYAGCIDSTALNFNQQANIDDGSCEYPTNIGTLDCGIDSVLYFASTLNYGFENSVYYSFDLDNDSEMIINLAGFSNYILLFDSSQTYLQSIQSDNYSNNYSINLNAGEYYMVVTQDNPFFYEGTIQNYYNIMKTVYNNIDSFALRLFSYDGTCNYPGCTDYTAFNFNPDATIDNGSCDYPTDLGTLECGITYSTTLDTINGNYGYETFVEPQNFAVYNFSLDSSSVLEISYEIDIFNYEFGSCYVFLFDNYSLVNIWIHLEGYGGFYTSGDIPSQIDLPPGSYTLFYGNYDSDMYITEGMNINEVTSQFSSYSNDSEHFSFKMGLISYDGTCDYPGCIDSTALNFNTNATNDDGSCQYIYACTDESALNYNPDATTDNGSCDYPTDLGTLTCGLTYSTSIDTLAGNCNINYDGPVYEAYSFTIDTTSSVEISFYECILGDLCALYNPVKILLFENGYLVDWWEEFPSDCYSWPSNNLPLDIVLSAGDYHLVYGYSNIELYEGLGLEEAISEFITATTANFMYYNASVTLQMELITYDETCDYPGCIDSTAINFNPIATIDDGSCIYDVLNIDEQDVIVTCGAILYDSGGADGAYMNNENQQITIYPESSGQYVSLFFSEFQFEGCCDYLTIYDGESTSASVLVPASNGTSLLGQTFTATEINASGALTITFTSDGSVTYPGWAAEITCTTYVVSGCMDPDAYNYNDEAQEEDGSCYYVPNCQTLNMPIGWSIFSSYIIPNDISLESILEPIIDNIIVAKNNAGAVYMPEFNFNGIGNILVGQGYQIKTDAELSLELCGEYTTPEENQIFISEGWNMIGYLRLEPASVVNIFADMVSAGNLIIVKNYAGLVYMPEYNFNGIGDMQAGQGYQLKTFNDDALLYNSNSDSYNRMYGQNDIIINDLKFYPKVELTDNNMTIIIPDNVWDHTPSEGAEISVYDKKGLLVGASIYSSPTSVITVWGDDHTTDKKDGLYNLESLEFRIWDQSEEKSFEVLDWKDGSNKYVSNAINIAGMINTNNNLNTVKLFDAIPNPSENKTNISFYIPKKHKVKIDLCDILGKSIYQITNSEYEAGTHELEIDVSNLNGGSYFYKMTSGNFIKTNQLVILR